ncbi:MAG: hypothetical protein QM820_49910 [Minicystis sp.]
MEGAIAIPADKNRRLVTSSRRGWRQSPAIRAIASADFRNSPADFRAFCDVIAERFARVAARGVEKSSLDGWETVDLTRAVSRRARPG